MKKASFVDSLKAVAWSFLGIRKKKDYESDSQNLNPVHVILAGILAAAIFVFILIIVVRSVVA